MSSQLSILQKNERADYQRYRFYLQNASRGLIELNIQPDGWDDGELEYQRSATYKGVSRTVSVKELMFVKEGRDYLQDVYEQQGPIARVNFIVDYLKSDYTYANYYTGLIDLFTYDINEDGVKVSISDTSFKSKVYTRDDQEINLLNLTSIDGDPITDWTAQSILMPDTSINRQSDYVENSSAFITASPHLVPMAVQVGSDFTETQDQLITNAVSGANGFFPSSTTDRIIRVHGTTVIVVIGDGSPHDWTVDLRVYVYDSAGVFLTWYNLDNGIYNNEESPTFNLSFDREVTVLEGQSLAVVCEISPVGATYKIAYDSVTLAADETFDGTPAHVTYGMQYYEAFLRACQLITGEANPFYSDYFGRTDTPLTTYASDGQIGFIVRGIYFRLTTAGALEYPLAVTFKDLFDTLSAVYNLGMAVETIDEVDKVRIEAVDHFFSDAVVLDISNRIRTQNIEKSCKADWFYKSINVGYNKFEYDQVEGLFEYNTKSIFTTSLLVASKLDIVATYRADNQGIRLLLKAPDSVDYQSSKDYKGDDEIFILDAFNDGGTYTASMDEDFSIVGGTIYADRSFNLKITPKRNLLRNGKQIKAGMTHSLGDYLRWQASDKNTNLYTRLSTESANVRENADVQVIDLDDCRWLNEVYKVQAYLTPAEKLAIDANMNGLIKLSADKYGWILSLKTKNKDGKAEFEILRANLNVVTPS